MITLVTVPSTGPYEVSVAGTGTAILPRSPSSSVITSSRPVGGQAPRKVLSREAQPVIKIRYACLPEGLHATAVARGRHATIYLRPGLRPGQRRDALTRLRRNARLGYAPPLPAAGVAWALAADRIRRTLRDLRGALQCHPLGALGMAGVLAGAAVSYMTLMAAPLPAAGPVSAASLPAAGDGETALAGRPGSAGLPASALVPLGMKPRRWTVPDARPRHRQAGQRQRQYTGRPGPHPPARHRPHHHYRWRWPRRPPGGMRAGRPGRDAHGWPPRHWRGGTRERQPPQRQPHGRQPHGPQPHGRQRPGSPGGGPPAARRPPSGRRPSGGQAYYPRFRAWPRPEGPDWGAAGGQGG